MAAIREKHWQRFYTSPKINSKQEFIGGRFEFRVALPKGKMLRPIIFLNPSKTTGRWPFDGEIDIQHMAQKNEHHSGIIFSRNGEAQEIVSDEHIVLTENVYEFQTYILEWTPSEMRYMINERLLYTINMTDSLADIQYNPFTKPFKIHISLGVGGPHFFPGQILYDKDADEWECSLMIFDFIRVYQNVSENVVNPDLPEPNNVTSSDICSLVMPLIRHRKQNWNLVFTDEFNETENIDQDVWEMMHDLEFCAGKFIPIENYNLN